MQRENSDNNWLKRFRSVYKPIFKSEYDSFESNLATLKNKTFRVNTNRGINYFAELDEKISYTQHKAIDNAYILDDIELSPLSQSISHKTGGVYIMNASSILTAKIFSSLVKAENPIILDVSSAPGGKTSAISDYLGRKGMIIANELSLSRLKSLHYNLEKNGCYNVVTTNLDGRILDRFFAQMVDAVLLDAPCSNENKIFRDKTVQSDWSVELTHKLAKLQKELIISAYDCLKPGGILLYSTCTMSIAENEEVIKHLLDTKNSSEIIDINKGAYHKGVLGVDKIDEAVARIMPDEKMTDGFFIAALYKKGESDDNILIVPKYSKEQLDFIKKHFNDLPENLDLVELSGRGYIRSNVALNERLKFRRTGLSLYKTAGKNYELMSQSLWEFGRYINRELCCDVTLPDAEKYLKGFDLSYENNYNEIGLFYNEIPLGTVKRVTGGCKNKLDRYFLYGINL